MLFYLFCFSNCHTTAISFFSWHLCSFVTLLSLCFCFWVLSYFCTTRYIRLILCITCQSPGISHFSKSWLTFLPPFPLIVSSFNLCSIYFFWLFFLEVIFILPIRPNDFLSEFFLSAFGQFFICLLLMFHLTSLYSILFIQVPGLVSSNYFSFLSEVD